MNLNFDGKQSYVEIPDSADFSLSTTGGLTVSAWMRPDALTFPSEEGEGYVHWLGKGEAGQQEWTFRMYGADNTALFDTSRPELGNRGNRISFYLFNRAGKIGIGSYFQDSIQAGAWIHVVGTADADTVSIYRDGVHRFSRKYRPSITPEHGIAPLRIGTRDFHSFFQGAIREVRVWQRALSGDEVASLFGQGTVPPDGLVAEYPMTQDVIPDTHGHDGINFGAAWTPGS